MPMSQMTRVGIVVELSTTWLGGLNYFRNLLRAIDESTDRHVEVVVFTGLRGDAQLAKDWPAEIVRHAMFDEGSPTWYTRKVLRRLCGFDPFAESLLRKHRIDVLSHSDYLGRRSRIPSLPWITDLQHHYLPEHFPARQVKRRNAYLRRLSREGAHLVVSSNVVKQDLVEQFGVRSSHVDVLQFVSEAVPGNSLPTLDQLQSRYSLPSRYIYVPNQFWSHKNHRAVIEAVGLLQKVGNEVFVVCTGRQDDNRDPAYFPALETRLEQPDVRDRFRLLGVVPKQDVDALLLHCRFVINPSFFEGWSSTVEEAKAIGKHLLLSDIPVHREQAPACSDYFDPSGHQALAKLIWARWAAPDEPTNSVATDRHRTMHRQRRTEFAATFSRIVTARAGR